MAKIEQLIRETQPDLVISHEECAALPMAKALDIPTIFITEWFSDPDDIQMQALSYADDVIVIEEEGIFEEPPNVCGRAFYTGPVLRPFTYAKADRPRARQELGFPQEAIIILVLPGGWATEAREPIYEYVISAFDTLKEAPSKLLVWLAGTDCDALTHRAAGRANVMIKDYDWRIDRLMVASDVAVTKANRVTIRELAALGIPSISISHGSNPIDDVLIERIPTNIPPGRKNGRSEIAGEQLA